MLRGFARWKNGEMGWLASGFSRVWEPWAGAIAAGVHDGAEAFTVAGRPRPLGPGVPWRRATTPVRGSDPIAERAPDRQKGPS